MPNPKKKSNLKESSCFKYVIRILGASMLILPLYFLITSLTKESYQVKIKLDTSALEDAQNVRIRGNISPINSQMGMLMSEKHDNDIYEIVFTIYSNKKLLKFKFAVDGMEELVGSDQREIWLDNALIEEQFVFNEYKKYNRQQIDSLIYSPEQINEDIDILMDALSFIHPNIYRYKSKVEMDRDKDLIKSRLIAKPNLEFAFAEISKFVADIKCSHTFTNPWNQGYTVKKAIFHQDDKLPFTFKRVGTQILIEKDASENKVLKYGDELLKINGLEVDSIFSKLTEYIASDGVNYGKRLNRLLLTGRDKFELFDIFYPLVFGTGSYYELTLRNYLDEEIRVERVKSISKTLRSLRIKERYPNIGSTFAELWRYKKLDQNTAQLKIGSFSVVGKNFDWREFLDSSFSSMNADNIANLILDIRGNEGGQNEVVQYILERLIDKPFSIEEMQTSVRYLEIPDRLKPYIRTWDETPYSFHGEYQRMEGNRYILNSKYGVGKQTFYPRADGFKGRVFLLTDATNSSATHILASYSSMIDNITIVGQETGGSVNGINAGHIFFLRLPNSKIEVDVPVISFYIPLNIYQKEGGIKPDFPISQNALDFVKNIDTEVEYIIDCLI